MGDDRFVRLAFSEFINEDRRFKERKIEPLGRPPYYLTLPCKVKRLGSNMSVGYTTLAAMTCVVVAGTMAFRGPTDRAEELQAVDLPTHQARREGQSVVADLHGGMLPRREDRSLVGQLYRQGFVTVVGQVNSPGRVAYAKGVSLGRVIDQGGGATPFGAMKRVRLTRDGKIYQYNLDKPNSREVTVLPGDVVTVPEKMVFGR